MTRNEFEKSLKVTNPPEQISDPLAALWWDAKGSWEKAHQIAQDIPGTSGAWVHAYLHRKEGDEFNAGYWYRQAGKPRSREPLEDEWGSLVEYFLKQ